VSRFSTHYSSWKEKRYSSTLSTPQAKLSSLSVPIRVWKEKCSNSAGGGLVPAERHTVSVHFSARFQSHREHGPPAADDGVARIDKQRKEAQMKYLFGLLLSLLLMASLARADATYTYVGNQMADNPLSTDAPRVLHRAFSWEALRFRNRSRQTLLGHPTQIRLKISHSACLGSTQTVVDCCLRAGVGTLARAVVR
jgi:hypothetical protein